MGGRGFGQELGHFVVVVCDRSEGRPDFGIVRVDVTQDVEECTGPGVIALAVETVGGLEERLCVGLWHGYWTLSTITHPCERLLPP